MSYKFNPFTGTFDQVGGGGAGSELNFSYNYIAPGQDVEIPAGQEMLIDGPVRVLGHLSVNGRMVDVSARKPEAFFYDRIAADEVVEVYPARLLMFNQHLTVDGHLRVNGRLVQV